MREPGPNAFQTPPTNHVVRSFAAAIFSIAFAFCGALISDAKSTPPLLPRTAKTIAGLTPKGVWEVVSTAEGDLNNDGKPDAAVVAKYDNPDGRSVSRLAVALKDANGYKIAEESDSATMLACGPSGTPPSLEIRKGVLLVHQECGSRARYSFTYKYQLRKDKWLLIGYEASKFDSMAPNASTSVDVNFVTGEVEAALTEDSKKTTARFLEIRAPRIQATGPGITDWAVPRIVVRPLTKAAPAIATQAVYNNKHLFIRTQYDPPAKVTPFKVSLVDTHGKTIPFVDSAVTPYGYILQSYDLNNPAVKAATIATSDWAAKPDALFHLTLEIQPEENATGAATVKTSRKSPGAVLLSGSHEPISLDNINVETDPMPHPFMFKLPTD